MTKPNSPACERNSAPILDVIRPILADSARVLEIGSGTGQHAVFFSERMPNLEWHTSDLEENHAGIRAWIRDAGLNNIHGPHKLDVTQPDWPELDIDAIFSANVVHIISWDCVCELFSGCGRSLPNNGLLILYGPFNYNREYTSQSNADFDTWLRQRDPRSAIRNFEDLDHLARQQGMVLMDDIEMPSNNRILCWKKTNQLIIEVNDEY